MTVPPAEDPTATTRIDCENTRGYHVKRGVHAYEYCPFCGHSIGGGADHEVVVTIDH